MKWKGAKLFDTARNGGCIYLFYDSKCVPDMVAVVQQVCDLDAKTDISPIYIQHNK